MATQSHYAGTAPAQRPGSSTLKWAALVVLLGLALAAPFQLYPVFLAKALCFALFACAFNLLIGYGGLLSFGHAMFMGTAGYVTAHMAKVGTIGFKVPLIGEFMINMGPLSPELSLLSSPLARSHQRFFFGVAGLGEFFFRYSLASMKAAR